MAGLLHDVAVRLAWPVPPAAAVPVAHPGQTVLRPPRARGGPPVVEGAPRPALVAHHRAVALHQVNAPPAQVGREEGRTATGRDEVLHMVAHRLAPVLVVPHAHHQPVAGQQVGLAVHVQVGAELHLVAFGRQPPDEGGVPVREGLPRRAGVVVVRGAEGDASDAAAWALQAQTRPRARRVGRAGRAIVEAAAARPVVGLVGGDRQLVHEGAAARPSHHEERGGTVHRGSQGLRIGLLQVGDVHTGRPGAPDGELVCRPAPVGLGAAFRGGEAVHPAAGVHVLETVPPPVERHAKTRRVGGHVQHQRAACVHAGPRGVAADHARCSSATGPTASGSTFLRTR